MTSHDIPQLRVDTVSDFSNDSACVFDVLGLALTNLICLGKYGRQVPAIGHCSAPRRIFRDLLVYL